MNVVPLVELPQQAVDADHVEFISLVRLLLQHAQEGTLKELHGIAVYKEEEQVDLVSFGAGVDTATYSDIIVELLDLVDDLRSARRGDEEEEE